MINHRLNDLKPIISVYNSRRSITVNRVESDFCCELALDTVTYKYGDKEAKDYQIEIELKSDHHIYKVELKDFAQSLLKELQIKNYTNEQESKYLKALNMFDLLT